MIYFTVDVNCVVNENKTFLNPAVFLFFKRSATNDNRWGDLLQQTDIKKGKVKVVIIIEEI